MECNQKETDFPKCLSSRYSLEKIFSHTKNTRVYYVKDRWFNNKELILKIFKSTELELGQRETNFLLTRKTPSIARIFDLGEISHDKDRFFYFTRQYITGNSVRSKIPLKTKEDFINIIYKLIDALKPLHKISLYHGDLKPENIILSPDNNIILIDFAFAGNSSQTQLPSGTIHYMAPEIFKGDKFDTRIDIYAIGIIIFELLTGSPPFKGNTNQIIEQHLNKTPEIDENNFILDSFNRIEINTLTKIILKSLEKDPQDRIQNIEELEAMLTQLFPTLSKNDDYKYDSMPYIDREIENQIQKWTANILIEKEPASNILTIKGDTGIGKTEILRNLNLNLRLHKNPTILVSGKSFLNPREAIESVIKRISENFIEDCHENKENNLNDLIINLDKKVFIIWDDVDAVKNMAPFLRRLVYNYELKSKLIWIFSTTKEIKDNWKLYDSNQIEINPFSIDELDELLQICCGSKGQILAPQIFELSKGNPLLINSILNKKANIQETVISFPEDKKVYFDNIIKTLSENEKETLFFITYSHQTIKYNEIREEFNNLPDINKIISKLSSEGLIKIENDIIEPSHFWKTFAPENYQDRLKIDLKLAQFWERNNKDVIAAIHYLRSGDKKGIILLNSIIPQLKKEKKDYEIIMLLEEAIPNIPLKEKKDYLELLLNLYVESGEYQKAKIIIESIEKNYLDKNSYNYCKAKALINMELGAFDEAEQSFNQCFKMKESKNETDFLYYQFGRLILKKGNYQELLNVISNFSSKTKDLGYFYLLKSLEVTALNYLASFSIAEEKRLEIINNVDSLKQKSGDIYSYLGFWSMRDGDYISAENYFNKAKIFFEKENNKSSLTNCYLNIGSALSQIGQIEQSIINYEKGLCLASELGKDETHVWIRNNLSLLYLEIGMLEKAGREININLEIVDKVGLIPKAQAWAQKGELAAKKEEWVEAYNSYNKSLYIYSKLGQLRETVEIKLEIANLVLDYLQSSGSNSINIPDASIENIKIIVRDIEKTIKNNKELAIFYPLFCIVKGKVLLKESNWSSAEQQFKKGLQSVDAQSKYNWIILGELAYVYYNRGEYKKANECISESLKNIEDYILKIPSNWRTAFWNIQTWKKIKALEHEIKISLKSNINIETELLFRLIDINRKLVLEQSLDELSEEILDSGIEFCGAERGFLFLPDSSGQLEVKFARNWQKEDLKNGFYFEFSRSIVESAIIDREPIITINAMDDNRFREFLSVYSLKLKSIVCIPLELDKNQKGALYLENRWDRGRFNENHKKILSALGDVISLAWKHGALKNEVFHLKNELSRNVIDKTPDKIETKKTITPNIKDSDDEIPDIFHNIICASKSMKDVIKSILKIKDLSLPVFLYGETGCGKDIIAHLIHELSQRRKHKFVKISCSSIPESLIESELFGYKQGSFTGANKDKTGLITSAHQGTLFLDEIENMSSKMQVVMLRIIQEGKVTPIGSEREIPIKTRVISASKIQINSLIKQNIFREDLYYRLAGIEILIPPLKDRRQDIPLIISDIIDKLNKEIKYGKKTISDKAMNLLTDYDWPGNIIQLKHILTNAYINCEKGIIDLYIIKELIDKNIDIKTNITICNELYAEEKEKIINAVRQCGGNRTNAAKLLKMPRRTFYRKLQKYGLI